MSLFGTGLAKFLWKWWQAAIYSTGRPISHSLTVLARCTWDFLLRAKYLANRWGEQYSYVFILGVYFTFSLDSWCILIQGEVKAVLAWLKLWHVCTLIQSWRTQSHSRSINIHHHSQEYLEMKALIKNSSVYHRWWKMQSIFVVW